MVTGILTVFLQKTFLQQTIHFLIPTVIHSKFKTNCNKLVTWPNCIFKTVGKASIYQFTIWGEGLSEHKSDNKASELIAVKVPHIILLNITALPFKMIPLYNNASDYSTFQSSFRTCFMQLTSELTSYLIFIKLCPLIFGNKKYVQRARSDY